MSSVGAVVIELLMVLYKCNSDRVVYCQEYEFLAALRIIGRNLARSAWRTFLEEKKKEEASQIRCEKIIESVWTSRHHLKYFSDI